MDNIDPNVILQKAALIHSAEAVVNAIATLAAQINQDYANETPTVLSVMSGGAIFAGQLLPQLTFPLNFDYVQASRYNGATQGKALQWIIKPKNTIKKQKVLILDDILDEGITLSAVVDACRQFGALEVKTAVLVEKILHQSKPICANYVGLQVPNRYVFGCGMDINGWWRNLPAIYAI